jgi:hypothetical protein
VTTVTVKYTGPPGQQVPLLAAHGHAGVCRPDETYELPEDVAERLARSSRWFRVMPAASTAAAAPKRRRSRKAPASPSAPEPAAEDVQAGDEEDTEP